MPSKLFSRLNNQYSIGKISKSTLLFANKTCISSKITLGLTKLSTKPVPIRPPRNEFLFDVLEKSKAIKKHIQDMKSSTIDYVNKALERKKNIGKRYMSIYADDNLKNVFDKFENIGHSSKNSKLSHLDFSKPMIFEQTNEDSLKNNSSSIGSSINPLCNHLSPDFFNKESSSPEDKLKNLKKISSSEEYASYKKRFKIRPRYASYYKDEVDNN
ncbi:hypothetical protein SteCoe_7969 [Stentor coeruleus]|uniref:Uncharacterized protein n=1 Tax=Stentor coeruleus TaxID=5963 RepID=A0A1R2CLE9_9CILI|nr:hypothetical protein SteCoe_7969 [Stentor coeruleus]